MRFWWILAGVLSLIGGFFALANPFSATLAAEWLAGWAFLFSGVAIAVSAFSNKSAGSWIMALIVGVFVVLLGLFLLANPLQGIVSLTVAVAFFLVAAGLGRILWAFQAEGGARWALILSGILSLVLGFMVFGNFAGAALTLLGILLGVELISNGVSLLVLGIAGKSQPAKA